MKNTAKQLIQILKTLVNIAWYGNFVLIIAAGFFLGRELIFNNYIETSYNLELKRQDLLKGADKNSPVVKNLRISTTAADISFEMKNSLFVRVSSLLLFAMIELLITAILYHLRKLFFNLKQDRHFEGENVSALKRVAFLVALIFPLQLLIQFTAQTTLNLYLLSNYSVRWEANFYVLIIAAILYIVAEIFNRGLELRKENEEFV